MTTQSAPQRKRLLISKKEGLLMLEAYKEFQNHWGFTVNYIRCRSARLGPERQQFWEDTSTQSLKRRIQDYTGVVLNKKKKLDADTEKLVDEINAKETRYAVKRNTGNENHTSSERPGSQRNHTDRTTLVFPTGRHTECSTTSPGGSTTAHPDLDTAQGRSPQAISDPITPSPNPCTSTSTSGYGTSLQMSTSSRSPCRDTPRHLANSSITHPPLPNYRRPRLGSSVHYANSPPSYGNDSQSQSRDLSPEPRDRSPIANVRNAANSPDRPAAFPDQQNPNRPPNPRRRTQDIARENHLLYNRLMNERVLPLMDRLERVLDRIDSDSREND